jgi:anti-anti-sigma factor
MLDLQRIDRIDAAGIAALISLYSTARIAGHEFTVCNVPARVAEILALVGLDHILFCQDISTSHITARFERSAA